jgi:hypothetical protein
LGSEGLNGFLLKIWRDLRRVLEGAFQKYIFIFEKKNKDLSIWWFLGFVGVSVNFGFILHAIWWRWAQPGGSGGAGDIDFVGCVAVLVVFRCVDAALGLRFDAATTAAAAAASPAATTTATTSATAAAARV